MSVPVFVDNTVETATGDPITISGHVIASGLVDSILICSFAVRDTLSQFPVVDWKGTDNLTPLIQTNSADGAAAIFYLLNPSSGTDDVVINWDGVDSRRTVAVAATYTNVNQSRPFRRFDFNDGADSNPTINITGQKDELIIDIASLVGAGPAGLTADHTERFNDAATGFGNDTRGAGQEVAGTGVTETMGWTKDASILSWVIIAAILQPPRSLYMAM